MRSDCGIVSFRYVDVLSFPTVCQDVSLECLEPQRQFQESQHENFNATEF